MPVTSWLPRLAALLSLLTFTPPAAAQTSDNAGALKFQSVADAKGTEAGVEAGLPDRITAGQWARLPLDVTPLPDGLGTQVVPRAYLPTLSALSAEPQHGWVFPRVVYIYIPDGAAGANRLLCRLHYTQVSDEGLAGRMGGLLALIHRTLVTETGREGTVGTTPFDVWLCRAGQSGGEQWRDNIYFYDLDTPRSSIEWVREVAHEYGHLALPPIGGYADPEYWANGYYGERLLVRWVARAPGGPARVAQVWGDFSGWPNFQKLLIAPPLALYKGAGPGAALAGRTDEKGMRYLIGQILTFDDKYGARRLADAFSYLPHAREARGPDLGPAFALELSRQARQP